VERALKKEKKEMKKQKKKRPSPIKELGIKEDLQAALQAAVAKEIAKGATEVGALTRAPARDILVALLKAIVAEETEEIE